MTDRLRQLWDAANEAPRQMPAWDADGETSVDVPVMESAADEPGWAMLERMIRENTP